MRGGPGVRRSGRARSLLRRLALSSLMVLPLGLAGCATTEKYTFDERDIPPLKLDGELISMKDAAAFVRKEAKANPKVQAVISADIGVKYGDVVDVIDMVKQSGVTTFALDVERGPAGEFE